MATDNNVTLENGPKRSVFGKHERVMRSQKIGQVSTVGCDFYAPKSTLKQGHTLNTELKPTITKVSTPMRSHMATYAVPLRTVWRYYDRFIGKGDSFLRTGAFNMSVIDTLNSTSIDQLPHMPAGNILAYMLLALGNGNENLMLSPTRAFNNVTYNQLQYKDLFALEGNKLPYAPYYYDSEGKIRKCIDDKTALLESAANFSGNTAVLSWLAPRVIGNGINKRIFLASSVSNEASYSLYQPSGYEFPKALASRMVNRFMTEDPELITTAKMLFGSAFKGFDVKRIIIEVFPLNVVVSGSTSDYLGGAAFRVYASDTSIIDCGSVSNSFCMPVGSANPMQFSIENTTVQTGVQYPANHRYGRIRLQTSDNFRDLNAQNGHFCLPFGNMTHRDNDANMYDYSANVFNFVATALLGSSELCGPGSLLDDMGVALFERYSGAVVNQVSIMPKDLINTNRELYTYQYSTPYGSFRKGFESYGYNNVGIREKIVTGKGSNNIITSDDFAFWGISQRIYKDICADSYFTYGAGTYGDEFPSYGPMINVLPFFCYQKVFSERFLLPHDVLSNNQQQTSELDSMSYDSPYYRNNMVPTECVWSGQIGGVGNQRIDLGCLILSPITLGSGGYSDRYYHFSLTGANESDMNSSTELLGETKPLGPLTLSNCLEINQFLSIFLPRNVMRGMDVLTKNWQCENNNVQNILDAAQYGIVNDDNVLDCKKYLMSHALSRFVRFGGTNQTAAEVIKKHFGLNSVPTDHKTSILISTHDSMLSTEEVINTGGAIDESGNARPLGDKCSIGTNTLNSGKDFEVIFPEYSFLISLHWLDVDTYRSGVPEPATYDLVPNRKGDRDNFRIAFDPEFQAVGDDPIFLSDIEFGADDSRGNEILVGWTNKNFRWKDSGLNVVRGEWLSKFNRQIITTGSISLKNSHLYAPALNYGYLQPECGEYELPLVDKFGDALLEIWDFNKYIKCTMTKTNNVGL